MTREVSLLVNEKPVALDYFVQSFIDHTMGGMLEALEGTGEIRNLQLTIEGDQVTINLNGAAVPLKPFVNTVIRNMVSGLISSLKGVESPQRVKLHVSRS